MYDRIQEQNADIPKFPLKNFKIFPKPPHSDTFPERSDNRKYFCVRRLHSQEIQFDPLINSFSVNLLQQRREKFAGSQPTWMARLRWKSKASFLARVLFALVSTTCFRNLACTNILTSKKNDSNALITRAWIVQNSILVGHFSLVCFMSWLPGTESYHC